MTGEGTVISVSGNEAVVRICKSSACSHNCSECSACSNPSYETSVQNQLGAKCSDRVLIEDSTGTILSVSLVVYMLPVFLMIAAAAFCEAMQIGAVQTVLIFVCLLSVWFAVIRYVNKKYRCKSRIIQILKD